MILGDEWPRVNYSQAQSRARYEARHAANVRNGIGQHLFERLRSQLYQNRCEIAAWARRRQQERELRHQAMLFASCLRSLICERVIRAWARVVTWETNSRT